MDARIGSTIMSGNFRTLLCSLVTLVAGTLAIGTWRYPDFWRHPDRRGDALMKRYEYASAAKAYADPWRLGIALYREARFKDAEKAFARVPGAAGAFNAGNALMMQGRYDAAITRYDKALVFQPGWQEALDNKQIATARRDQMKGSDKDREEESSDAYDPDEITFDQKGEDHPDPAEKPIEGAPDDAALQATWLRRVKTTPGQFLKSKFAWQAQNPPGS